MKKGFLIVLPIAFCVFFFSTQLTHAYTYQVPSFFGGRITDIEAVPVELAEDDNYVCSVDGTSLSIAPIGSPGGTPTDYLIPFTVPSSTSTSPAIGELILGAYMGQSSVPCKRYNPETKTIERKTIYLSTITIFGTSGGVITTPQTPA